MPEGPIRLRPDVAAAALAGLRADPKTLPSKLFYDELGCELFDAITTLPEYYVTRVELALLCDIVSEVAAAVPEGVAVVEYGAGTEAKAAILLRALRAPSAYVPIDVAGGAIEAAAGRLRDEFPGLRVLPVEADFLAPLALPVSLAMLPRLGFFPGSTIGNLEPHVAVRFLGQVRQTLGAGSLFLIGADLRKDPAILIPAYDDAAGVTAAFNLNMLVRLNREAGADFALERFAHQAVWNAGEGRIEMHLVSLDAQQVLVAGQPIAFAPGETIHTENSYKHTADGLRALAAQAGWTALRSWTDADAMFGLHLFRG